MKVLLIATVALALAGVASAAPGKRLTKAQWQAYVTADKTFGQTTTASVAVFRRCRALTGSSGNHKALVACLGATPAKQVAATERFFGVLHAFEPTVLGSCRNSLVHYEGGVYTFRTQVVGIQRSAANPVSTVVAIENQAENAILAQANMLKLATAFSRDCRPLG
jgi:hypothetical protein